MSEPVAQPVAEKRWQRVGWSLLAQWYCVPEDMTEAEQSAFVAQLAKDIMTPAVIPTFLVRDRLYGGFNCAEAGRVHVLFRTGDYTYINPHLNEPVSAERRAENWVEDIERNGTDPQNAWRGKVGPFTEDAPVQASRGAALRGEAT